MRPVPALRAVTAALTAIAAGALGVLGPAPAASAAGAHGTQRVSSDATDHDGNEASHSPAISADGRWVAFVSDASNLVRGDTNKATDVFLRDTTDGAVRRISVSTQGRQADDLSYNPSISDDGRFISFDSFATDLVPGDRNARGDAFVHDRKTGTTSRVSMTPDGAEPNAISGFSAISGDGRVVAFESTATNMGPDAEGAPDVYVWERETGTVEWVSRSSLGVRPDGSSGTPTISRDGRYVAFTSSAANLVPADTNLRDDIFVRDRQLQITRRVSLNSVGGESNHESDAASISADGRYVAFESMAYSLTNADPTLEKTPKFLNPLVRTGDDTNNQTDVFVHDMLTGRTEMVSRGTDGRQGVRESYAPSISADGRFVAFTSYADALVPADTNGSRDVFVRDRARNTTSRVSVGDRDEQGDNISYDPVISADGTRVAFVSDAANLVAGDRNREGDVFVRR